MVFIMQNRIFMSKTNFSKKKYQKCRLNSGKERVYPEKQKFYLKNDVLQSTTKNQKYRFTVEKLVFISKDKFYLENELFYRKKNQKCRFTVEKIVFIRKNRIPVENLVFEIKFLFFLIKTSFPLKNGIYKVFPIENLVFEVNFLYMVPLACQVKKN